MKLDVLLGLQWGDEGKGKIVDVLAPKYNVITRFQGGPNAGHSLEFNKIKHVLHTIPSGIFRPDTINIIGNGVVIDPVIFKKEIDALENMGVNIRKNLYISKKAHLILPSHRILDAASEASKGKTKIGSTLKGIGPAYMDKTGRNGIRVGDIISPDFIEKYNLLTNKHKDILKQYKFEYDLKEYEENWFIGINLLKSFQIIESEHQINQYLNDGKTILAEGAQGTLLDIDFGSYPFVTSSNTICAGACTGLGVAPNKIGKVFGVFKAYCTRVGSGPFPTELENATGESIRKQGHEYGATTGRPRRCGWLDLPALKYAIMLNGVTDLIVTKPDVLSGFKTIRVCTHYMHNGKKIDYLPYEINEPIEPVYSEFKGWDMDISHCKKYSELPEEFINYLKYIETEVKVPITIISVGPDREQTIYK
ncbi:MAG: adenylosuccinate synthase [Bacteroidetes bacterium GWC2_33_15]|nr:MAG: adenylosuccinate synthase [Bacteroidetes bacterium GWA2_33_15]OFX50043.1 MAG: adenylosuccinate synthase [Bacteroidetes bacterium GWC2_33_15]OFX65196.1 MAG: adenylosuccinate synthase [Bacteroidetes bacterium GWB2_32_14]OFX70422.1 MAG: adenylosuccinate synthase [Bacteroidetes bacterium GWD2_33_33]HAN19709.1 adenylosuccinate synthase [Bacteroidales bacterium]